MLSQKDIQSILQTPKLIRRDSCKSEYLGKSGGWKIKAELDPSKWPLRVQIYTNAAAGKVSFALFYGSGKATHRIYALDVGSSHRFPWGEVISAPHKHVWDEVEKKASTVFIPCDITANPKQLERLWQDFCWETRIEGPCLPFPTSFSEPELPL